MKPSDLLQVGREKWLEWRRLGWDPSVYAVVLVASGWSERRTDAALDYLDAVSPSRDEPDWDAAISAAMGDEA